MQIRFTYNMSCICIICNPIFMKLLYKKCYIFLFCVKIHNRNMPINFFLLKHQHFPWKIVFIDRDTHSSLHTHQNVSCFVVHSAFHWRVTGPVVMIWLIFGEDNITICWWRVIKRWCNILNAGKYSFEETLQATVEFSFSFSPEYLFIIIISVFQGKAFT